MNNNTLWLNSQDATIIVPANNTLYIEECEGKYDIRYSCSNGKELTLGVYKTKIRAIQVLHDILFKIFCANHIKPKDEKQAMRFYIYDLPED